MRCALHRTEPYECCKFNELGISPHLSFLSDRIGANIVILIFNNWGKSWRIQNKMALKGGNNSVKLAHYIEGIRMPVTPHRPALQALPRLMPAAA